MRIRADIDDPRWRACFDHIEQQVGEQEGSKHVYGKGHLQAIDRLAAAQIEDASIIDQHMQLRVALFELLGELPNGLLR